MDTTNIKLESERLVLRGFSKADLADFNEYASVPGVGEMAGWAYHKSIEESQKILDMFLAKKSNFALFHKADGKVIGSLELQNAGWILKHPDFIGKSSLELGYVLAKPYWGQGLAVEAAKTAINYAFQNGTEVIACNHFPENAQSRRVIEKLGFVYSHTGQFNSPMGKVFDELRYVLAKT
ncbi:MAG: GNAT family N-acetyltransferase [Turicibacter sp.]|nr:GNAT family N-acetyltransferase [Turicibacter sp.]